MNITVISLGRKGASPIFAYEMVAALVKQGCNITCILSEYIENIHKFINLKEQYPYLNLFFIKTYRSKFQFIINTLNIFNFIKLKKMVNNAEPDCIYIPMISIWSSILCFFLFNKKIITTIHDVNMHIGEKNIFFEKIYTYAIKKSTKIIVLSQGFISQIINKYGILQENICWIPHANFNYYVPPNDDCSVKNKIFNKILFFGRIYEYKGLSVLLKAMNILEKTNKNICLKIVGSGKLSKEEKILIEKLGDKVELINRWINEDDVHSFFKDIDLTVLPYIEASQSGVIVLSYGMKKPVIASDIGGLPEQILPNTGILVPPGNEKILAQTIIDLYKTPEKIIEMGNNAYEYAANELTWERSAEKLINFMT